jgi:hypothetical protein
MGRVRKADDYMGFDKGEQLRQDGYGLCKWEGNATRAATKQAEMKLDSDEAKKRMYGEGYVSLPF